MLAPGRRFFVGVDPNQCLLAFNVRDGNGDYVPKGWLTFKCKKKDTFKTSSKHSIYMAQQCVGAVRDLHLTLQFQDNDKVYLAVEQQRGRTNSKIEAYLILSGLSMGWEVVEVHPRTWKKSCNFTKGVGNNKQNKEQS